MMGSRNAATIDSVSASITIFSYDARSPPSSQPAPCMTRLAPPITAPHKENALS
jgi:hypothetical protein